MYRVTFYSYCGMPGIPREFETREEARARVALVLREAREDFPVATLRRGEEWEIQEGEAARHMVPDNCGVLRLRRITHQCRECESEHETRAEAFACCRERID